MNPIAQSDPALWQALCDESRRQESTLELIASENHVSPAVMAAAATPLTNKYAEGYPGKRYYGGGQYVGGGGEAAGGRAEQGFWWGDADGEAPPRGQGGEGGVLWG